MSWVQLIGQRLQERDLRESALHSVIADYQQLSRYAAGLRARRPDSVSSVAPSNTNIAPATHVAPSLAATAVSPLQASPGTAAGSQPAEELAQQLHQARTELSELYKTQSANAQRLLTLTDLLSSKEASYGESTLALEQLKRELDRSRRSEKDLQDAMVEKSRLVEMLQDELTGLTLELNQVEMRNEDLKRDNANLLQRWLDRMNDEVDRMNSNTEKELGGGTGTKPDDDDDDKRQAVLDAQSGAALKEALRDAA